jgi:lipoprotein-anchoring transpeptidase ErfK/SrfK
MPIIAALLTAIALLFAGAQSMPPTAEAAVTLSQKPAVEAVVSLSDQRMYLTVVDRMGIRKTITWKVSTGKAGFETPTGSFRPTWLSADHKSATYDDAPMPYAVFFTGGYAVHATEFVGRLGEAASHGCIRLAPENAAVFFKLVEAFGRQNTTIVVTA